MSWPYTGRASLLSASNYCLYAGIRLHSLSQGKWLNLQVYYLLNPLSLISKLLLFFFLFDIHTLTSWPLAESLALLQRVTFLTLSILPLWPHSLLPFKQLTMYQSQKTFACTNIAFHEFSTQTKSRTSWFIAKILHCSTCILGTDSKLRLVVAALPTTT